ncbi:hypothetical protein Avbf_19120, partial [Armadillidium vulgare]
EKHFFCNFAAAPSGGKHYELPPADPTPRKESSISDSDYDFTYSLFLNSDMIEYSQPPSSLYLHLRQTVKQSQYLLIQRINQEFLPFNHNRSPLLGVASSQWDGISK